MPSMPTKDLIPIIFHSVFSYATIKFTDALAKRDITYLFSMLSLSSTKHGYEGSAAKNMLLSTLPRGGISHPAS